MSTFSENLFAVLGEGGDESITAPNKEEKNKKVEQAPKSENKRATKKANDTTAGRPNKRSEGRRPPRREFDRHSGTGLVDSEKKIKQSWGHAETAEAEAAKDAFNSTDPNTAAEKKPPSATAQPEEEEKVKTFDEYLAEQANKSLKVSLPEARKANDADESAFKGTVALKKKEDQEEAFFVSNKKSNKPAIKKEKTSRKILVDIEQRFEEKKSFAPRDTFRRGSSRGSSRGNSNSRRGGRGGRGGRGANTRRGGGDYKGRSKESNKAPAVNIQDVNAFPSLGAA